MLCIKDVIRERCFFFSDVLRTHLRLQLLRQILADRLMLFGQRNKGLVVAPRPDRHPSCI